MQASPETPLLPLLERLSQRWWFYILILAAFFMPAYSTNPFNPAETPKLIGEVLSNPLAYSMPAIFPLFKLLPLAMIAGLIFFPRQTSRWFYIWAGINLVVVAIFQDMAFTASYGFALLVGNALIYTFAGLLWIAAGFGSNGHRLAFSKSLPGWRLGVVVLAFFAFWFPVSTANGVPSPDFSPLGFIANEAGLTVCMMMPVYLAVLTLAYPDVDRVVLRVSGFIGFITGLFNVAQFFLSPGYGPWMCILHLPLLLISLYAFILSFRNPVKGYPSNLSLKGDSHESVHLR